MSTRLISVTDLRDNGPGKKSEPSQGNPKYSPTTRIHGIKNDNYKTGFIQEWVDGPSLPVFGRNIFVSPAVTEVRCRRFAGSQ